MNSISISVGKAINYVLKKVFSTAVLITLTVSAAHAQVVVYDNIDNFNEFSGYSYSNDGAAGPNTYTYMLADDINVLAGYGGRNVTSFQYTIGNLNDGTGTVSVSPIINFYAADGSGGAPGTLLGSFTLDPIATDNGYISSYTYVSPTGNAFTIPTIGRFWAGETFTSTTATADELNNIGMGLFDPPAVGSSEDLIFASNDPGAFQSSNPAGAQYDSPFGGDPVGNFGFELEVAAPTPAPEPSQFAALGLGVLGLGGLALRARRRIAA